MPTPLNGDISGWDVSNVQHMGAMFRGAAAFNQDISSWDVSSVTSMSLMFENTNSFDRPLNDWDVSNVQNMGGMFRDTDAFDRPLNDWDVSNVQNMNDMFPWCRRLQPRHILLGRLVCDQHASNVRRRSLVRAEPRGMVRGAR